MRQFFSALPCNIIGCFKGPMILWHVFALFPKQRWLGYLAIAYALCIGIGVSMTIHWFADFAAGAIIGTAIGTVVGSCLRSWLLNSAALVASASTNRPCL